MNSIKQDNDILKIKSDNSYITVEAYGNGIRFYATKNEAVNDYMPVLMKTKDEQPLIVTENKRAVMTNKNTKIELESSDADLTIAFYNDKNEVSMSFESSKGTYNEAKSQIILYEDTFIVLKDLTTLRANKLVWSGGDVPIIAEGNVKITRGNEFIATASEVEISPDYDRFKIIGNTVSKVYSDKEIK